MYNLYELLIEMCLKKGISGGKMCNDLGLSRSTMTDLKMGRKKTITFETAQKIADYFGVTVQEIYGAVPEGTIEQKRNEIFAKRKILFDLSEKVSEEDLDRVIKIMEAFKKEDE